jgi:hypothetical protein
MMHKANNPKVKPMPFSIILNRSIKAAPDTVWQVLTNTTEYPHWNPFVVGCESSFEVGSPIIMQVKLLPIAMKQKETVRINEPLKLLEYGINIPLLLHSSRKHVLTAKNGVTDYQSFFQLTGLLAPVVGFLLGRALNKGFLGMTNALVIEAEKVQSSAN